MRIALAFVIGVASSFLAAGVIRARLAEPSEPDVSWASSWLQPPPLQLPDTRTCTDFGEGVGVATPSPDWTASTVEEHLFRLAAEHAEIEVVDVDCDEAPCIAWLLWVEGSTDPALAYRWWSLEGDRGNAVWTASRIFDVPLPDAPDAKLQAVSIALPASTSIHLAPDRVVERVQRRLDEVRARLAPER